LGKKGEGAGAKHMYTYIVVLPHNNNPPADRSSSSFHLPAPRAWPPAGENLRAPPTRCPCSSPPRRRRCASRRPPVFAFKLVWWVVGRQIISLARLGKASRAFPARLHHKLPTHPRTPINPRTHRPKTSDQHPVIPRACMHVYTYTIHTYTYSRRGAASRPRGARNPSTGPCQQGSRRAAWATISPPRRPLPA
jgi:hypothetical protein